MRLRPVVVFLLACTGCPREEERPTWDVTANQEPVAAMQAPVEVAAMQEFTVDGTRSSDIDGTITEHAWSFDTGLMPVTGATLTHRYERPGLYTLELRVTDNAGKRGRARQRIAVTAPPDANPPSVEMVTLRRNTTVLTDGTLVGGGDAISVEVSARDDDGNLGGVVLEATGPLGAVMPTPSSPAAVTGTTATTTFTLTAPDAAGDLVISVHAVDAFNNESPVTTRTLRVSPAGADTDNDGLPDALDPDSTRFNGLQARVYALTSVPRDLLQRQKAEDVHAAVLAGTPVFTATVAQGFLRMPATAAVVGDLPGLSGGPALSTLFAIRYTGTLLPPAGATSVTVNVSADDLGVVFINGEAVASADQEYATDFFRVNRVPAQSMALQVGPSGVPVEILVANEDGPYGWQVDFAFSGAGGVVLGPTQVGQAQFLAPP